MSRVITFSRTFPAHHPQKGFNTFFVEKFYRSQFVDFDYKKPVAVALGLNLAHNFGPKHHTIRAGKRWSVGDKFSPRVWSDKPYRSKQIQFAPDVTIKKIWDFKLEIDKGHRIMYLNDVIVCEVQWNGVITNPEFLHDLAENDGLEASLLLQWFNKPFNGQIICWDERVNYTV